MFKKGLPSARSFEVFLFFFLDNAGCFVSSRRTGRRCMCGQRRDGESASAPGAVFAGKLLFDFYANVLPRSLPLQMNSCLAAGPVWLKMRTPTELPTSCLPFKHTYTHTRAETTRSRLLVESPLPSLITPGARWTLAFHSFSTWSLATRLCQAMTGSSPHMSRQRYRVEATRSHLCHPCKRTQHDELWHRDR